MANATNEKNYKKYGILFLWIFLVLRSLHNGVENPVENVENPCAPLFYRGSNMVMRKITQEHFREKPKIEMGNVGKGVRHVLREGGHAGCYLHRPGGI